MIITPKVDIEDDFVLNLLNDDYGEYENSITYGNSDRDDTYDDIYAIEHDEESPFVIDILYGDDGKEEEEEGSNYEVESESVDDTDCDDSSMVNIDDDFFETVQ